MTIDIDTRMRAAGERLRRSADAVPADTPPSPRSHVPLAAAAAVAVAVVVAAVAFGARDAGDRVDLATDPTGSTLPDASGDGQGGDLLHGDYPGGTWTVYIDADGRLCAAAMADDRGSSVCGELDERALTLRDNAGDPVVLFGAMPEGATRLRAAMLEVCATEPVRLPEPRDTPRIYALPTLGCEPGSVTFLDDDGNSVATEPVA